MVMRAVMGNVMGGVMRSVMHTPSQRSYMQLDAIIRHLLFSNSEQGVWLDPSNLASMYQDATGTIPVTGVEQPVGLMLDNRFGLARGPELRAGFVAASSGSPPAPATYNTDTGVGTAARTDSNNLSRVQFTGLAAGGWYRIEVSNTGPSPLSVRQGGITVVLASISSGQTRTVYVNATSDNISIVPDVNGTNIAFIVHSLSAVPGNHFYQTTTTNRPVLSARINLLTATQGTLASSGWSAVQASSTLQEDGSTLVARTPVSGMSSYLTQSVSSMPVPAVPGTKLAAQIKVKKATTGHYYGIRLQSSHPHRADVVVDLNSGAVVYTGGDTWTEISAKCEPADDGFWHIKLLATVGGSNLTQFIHGPAVSPTGSWLTYSPDALDAYVKEPQLEYGDVPSRYQRVTSATDYDWIGFPLYLRFDGTDDCLMSNAIDFTATNKVSVWAGLRRLSDAAGGAIVELSTISSSTAGTFGLFTPTGPASYNISARSSGSKFAVVAPSGFAAPLSLLLSVSADIAADQLRLRNLGAQIAASSSDQGSGTYSNNPLYIGSRAGTSLFFNGRIYGLIVRGASTPLNDLEFVERRYMANKMGISL